jgi:hypothetical protein
MAATAMAVDAFTSRWVVATIDRAQPQGGVNWLERGCARRWLPLQMNLRQ